jgi:hypothetical protein
MSAVCRHSSALGGDRLLQCLVQPETVGSGVDDREPPERVHCLPRVDVGQHGRHQRPADSPHDGCGLEEALGHLVEVGGPPLRNARVPGCPRGGSGPRQMAARVPAGRRRQAGWGSSRPAMSNATFGGRAGTTTSRSHVSSRRNTS